VPVLVGLEEKALGVLSPRSRAAAAEFGCLRNKGCASSSTACRLPRPALLWSESGDQHLVLGAPHKPHQVVAEHRCLSSTHDIWFLRAPFGIQPSCIARY
jgi:hypothetical protein